MKGRSFYIYLLLLLAVVASVGVMATGSQAANGMQHVQSGPSVYDQTTSEYATDWHWYFTTSTGQYHWYLFKSNGTIYAHNTSSSNGSINVPGNVYYWKEQNQSNHVLGWDVYYCC